MSRLPRDGGIARHRATFLTMSQVRVVTFTPNVRSMSVMNTGPFGPGR